MRRTRLAWGLLGLWLAGCPGDIADTPDDDDVMQDDDAGDDDTAADDDASADDDTAQDDDTDDATPVVDTEEFVEMFVDVITHLIVHETLDEGDWEGDFGDATAYAPPVLLTYGELMNNPEVTELGRSVLARELSLIDDLAGLDGWEIGEVVIGALGLIEAYAIEPDPAFADALERLFNDLIDPTMMLAGYYLPSGYDPFSGYGATTITALVAALYLEYVRVVAPQDAERLDMAVRIIEEIDAQAWDAAGYYLADPGGEVLELYPNVAMIHALARAHELGAGDYRAAAEACLASIESLYLADLEAYVSSSSPTYPDQAYLSSQNYAAIALLSLTRVTGDDAQPERAACLMRFARDRLLSDGIVYHHWQEGAAAYDYCTGCNFQLLFVLLQMGIAQHLA